MDGTIEIVVCECRQEAIETMIDMVNRLDTDTLWELADILTECFRVELLDAPPTMHAHSGELEPMPFRAMCLQVGADNLGMFQP